MFKKRTRPAHLVQKSTSTLTPTPTSTSTSPSIESDGAGPSGSSSTTTKSNLGGQVQVVNGVGESGNGGEAVREGGEVTAVLGTDQEKEKEKDEEENPTSTLQNLLLLRRYAAAAKTPGIDVNRLNRGEVKKKVKKPKADKAKSGIASLGADLGDSDEDSGDEDESEAYGLKKGKAAQRKNAFEEEEDPAADEASKAKRLVRSNNFTQQTNVLDVDKHMMAYIEEELAKKRGESRSTNDKSDPEYVDPQEELYRIAEKYRIENAQKPPDDDEGNVSTSLGMLTTIPEVDLGMDIRLRNIEETERAKRELLEQRRQPYKKAEDENFASARFFRPNARMQSDAEAMENARREAAGLPPLNRNRSKATDTATDDMVYERFKKRLRKN